MAAIQTFTWPAIVVEATNPSISGINDPIPSSATMIGGEDATGDLIPVAVDSDGDLQVDIKSSALPSGAATAANQDLEIAEIQDVEAELVSLNSKDFSTETTLSALNAKVTAVNTGAVVVSSSALPSGAATSANQDLEIAEIQDVEAQLVTLNSTDFSTETTLSALNAKVVAVDTGAVTISTALPAGNNNIGDVDVATLPVAFDAGAASATTQRVVIVTDQTSIPAAQSGTWTVQPGNTVNTTAWLVAEEKAATSTLSNVSGSASSVSLLASNTSRKNATFFNDSTAVAYLKLGTTASTTSYTVQIAAGGYYELPLGRIYTGAIDCIWAAANGAMRITELT